ncbi:MAG: hypothetical protein BSR46_02750 [Candidatus Dactylopiibacterium carminicum]|uniref:RDD family protein n=1 Tax=Candidatus Dactylopiibacterium carminicum TaxID=857335 RepID=UPI000BD3154E|nr:RDD family protein [Candidatus Dactylopiibacterium carminicum]PAT00475.1 MAG: hypothetical protein BSR46_02750 [Candidatus Dactylopiibacterium carminicum]
MLDTLRPVTTPELIEIRLHPAGLLPRALAWLIDLMLRFMLLALAGNLFSLLGEFGSGLWLLLFFLIEWFYPVLFEVLWRGSTPGKCALGLLVLNDNGTPVGWGASLTRNLLRTADFLPFGYALGAVSMLLHREFRRLGDIVAGTLVVYRHTTPATLIPTATPIPPTAPLGREAQRAILAFAERAPRLTPERQEELAALLPTLAHGAQPPQGAARLLRLANHLIGRQA